jgi:hypothetical protein
MKAPILASSHHDLSKQYGCAASMTIVDTVICGIPHRLRRFWREDCATTGKVEMYTICPGEEGKGVTAEDWLGHADPKTHHGRQAIAAVLRAAAERAGDLLGQDMSKRFQLLELF